jgi:hypothetical protein
VSFSLKKYITLGHEDQSSIKKPLRSGKEGHPFGRFIGSSAESFELKSYSGGQP